MSNFQKLTKHPKTGNVQLALWLDNYFGKHQYAIQFPDGTTFHQEDLNNSYRYSHNDKLPAAKILMTQKTQNQQEIDDTPNVQVKPSAEERFR